MTNAEAIPRLAAAIRAAVAEHGRPNTFGPGELALFYGGPPPIVTGRLLTSGHVVAVWTLLGGRDGWGSCPRYARGRIAV